MTLAAFLLSAAQAPAPEITVRPVDGDPVVDAVSSAVDPLDLVRRLAAGTAREVRGDDLLLGRPRIDVNLVGRPLEEVLTLLGHATRTRIELDGRAITIAPERDPLDVEGLELDAESAWVSLVREFPDRESARVARLALGIVQERRGNEDAALTHYDAAARDAKGSPAAERALKAASDLLMRHGEWDEAMHRLSRLAQSSKDDDTQASVRLAIARSLAEQGRGVEALALVDVVDLTYPAHDEAQVAERRLMRARAHLASGAPLLALMELDARAAADPMAGGQPDDLGLRAQALEELGSPREAARAWLARSTLVVDPAGRADALHAAARLSASSGDDIAVLFIERLARGTAREAEVADYADAARARLGLGPDLHDLPFLEERWSQRARVAPADRATLAADLVIATARERGAEAAAGVARTALDEVPLEAGRAIRAALAVAYESEGSWAEAARVWGGNAP